jgi:tetratricopeptide (TPR) repeat protein
LPVIPFKGILFWMPFLFPLAGARVGAAAVPAVSRAPHGLARAALLASLLGTAATAAADNLAEYLDIARSGAPALAVDLMERAQPEPAQDLVGWMQWEQEMIGVLAAWDEWAAILGRLSTLPDGVPEDFRDWSVVQRAKALIELGQGEAARELLRDMIWGPEEVPGPEQLALLRRLVVESYLADDAHADAREALLRYQQDYGVTQDTRSLRARVLLAADRFQEAAAVLADATAGEDLALRLHAELMSGRISPAQARDRLANALAQEGLGQSVQAQLEVVAAEAARRDGRPIEQILALERALALAPLEAPADGLLSPDPDDLWVAYLAQGEDRGNQAQLLLGNDMAWLEMAREFEHKEPAAGRAVDAVLVIRSRSAETREQAAGQLIESLATSGETSERVIQRLFLNSSRFGQIESVPLVVRYRLVDQALVRGDIELATRLMGGLERAPADADAIAWGLRRARVLVLGGRFEDGSIAVAHLIDAIEAGDRDLVDRILQVVFDLQAVQQHEAAIAHLQAVLKRSTDPQQRREILFWMADSYKALGDYQRAAFLYLRSATLYDPRAMDPWGQTARYNAAEQLASAGMIDDARRLYEQLLSVTREPARRAVLRQNIQQLWLKE